MFIPDPKESDAVRAYYDEARSEDGYVANHLRLWSWRLDVFKAFEAARARLASETTLSEREIALINSTTASRLGNAACSIAWGTRLAALSDSEAAGALLRRAHTAQFTPREQALIAWVGKVVADPNGTTSEDIASLRTAGLRDQEIFDATLLASFRRAFCSVNDALGAEPDRNLYDAAPPAVRDSVTYGRHAAGSAL